MLTLEFRSIKERVVGLCVLTLDFRSIKEPVVGLRVLTLDFRSIKERVVACHEGVIWKFDINAFMLKECTCLCLLVAC